MGTWDVDPFDNDTAADFCDDLDGVAESEREGMIRSILIRAADTQDYLDQDISVPAVAAAALVAAQCPGGEPVTTASAPECASPSFPSTSGNWHSRPWTAWSSSPPSSWNSGTRPTGSAPGGRPSPACRPFSCLLREGSSSNCADRAGALPRSVGRIGQRRGLSPADPQRQTRLLDRGRRFRRGRPHRHTLLLSATAHGPLRLRACHPLDSRDGRTGLPLHHP